MSDRQNTYIKNVSNEDYHGDKTCFSSSQLKKAIDSHANFKWEMSKPYEEPKFDRKSPMALGTALHCAALEPHLMETEIAFIDIDGMEFRSKENKIYLAKLLDLHKGKTILPNGAKKKVEIMMDGIKDHEFFNAMLSCPGEPEMSGYYRDKFYGVDLRIRPDRKLYDLDGAPAILDVKTCRDMDTFFKDAKWDRSYDLSAYMYVYGNDQITGEGMDVPFYFGVCETNPPYRTAVYKASEQFMEQGRRKYVKALSNIKLAYKQPQDKVKFQDCDYQEI